MLASVLPHFDALTHVVILLSSAFIFQRFAEVWYSVFVKRSSFKKFAESWSSVHRFVFPESSKAFIFQKFVVKFYFIFFSMVRHCLWKMSATPGACIKPGLVRRPLCDKVNLPSCVAWRPLCHKVNLPSCVARQPLCYKVNLPSCEAQRRHFLFWSWLVIFSAPNKRTL